MRLLDGDAVDQLATVELGLEAAEAAARLDRSKVSTGRVQIDGDVSWSRILAGSLSELDVTGYKEFHRVGQRVRYHINLFCESTADALGIVDGRRITSLRTSSTAAIAVKAWARDRTGIRVGVIGSGEEAREGLRALRGAIDISQATVFSPTRKNRESFAHSMSEALGLNVRALASQDGVLAESDVLYVATSAKHTPILSKSDLESIPMVAAVGATQRIDRELAGDAFNDRRVVVDVMDAVLESGDGVDAAEHGWKPESSCLLGEYLDNPGDPNERVLFKSIGSVEQDLVLGLRLLEAAEKEQVGVLVDPIGSLRIMR